MYSIQGPQVAVPPTSSRTLSPPRSSPTVFSSTRTLFSGEVAGLPHSRPLSPPRFGPTPFASERVVRGTTAAPYSDIVIPPTLKTHGATAPVVTTYGATAPVVTTHVDHAQGPTLRIRCACEFFGTLMLFLVVVLCPNALYIAAFYAALVYTFFFLSGAHLNPAITMGAFLVGKMPIRAFIAYVVSQVAGGMVGGLLFKLLFEYTSKTTIAIAVTPISPYTLTDAFTIEILYTVMLVFVALNVMCTQQHDKNQVFGIAFGFVIVAGGYAAAVVLGHALFNPALCLGLVTSTFKIGSCLWYILAEICSSIIGYFLFKICRFRDCRVEHVYEIERGAMETALYGTSVDTRTWNSHPRIYLITRMFSEFLGTFWLVVTMVINVALSSGNAAWSGAGVLISLIYALGGVSGGHFNPAVTLAIMIGNNKKCSTKDGACYIFAQLVSAIPAGFLASTLFKAAGPFDNSSDYGWFSIGFAEFVFTLILVYVVLVVATSETHASYHQSSQPNFYYAIAIGFVFVGASNAIGYISGGYLNPAVALGFVVDVFPSIKSTASVAGWAPVMNYILKIFSSIGMALAYLSCVLAYWVPEILGAIAAALVFRQSHRREFEKEAAYAYEARPVYGY